MGNVTGKLSRGKARELARTIAFVESVGLPDREEAFSEPQKEALALLQSSSVFETYRDSLTSHEPANLLALAKAELESFQAVGKLDKDLPENVSTILAKGLIIPVMVGVALASAGSIVSTSLQLKADKEKKIFESDYERTVNIVKQLDDLQQVALALKKEIGEDEPGRIFNDPGRSDIYDPGGASLYLSRADSLSELLRRATSLLRFDIGSLQRESELESFIEIQKLRLCLSGVKQIGNSQYLGMVDSSGDVEPADVWREHAEAFNAVLDGFAADLGSDYISEMKKSSGDLVQPPCGARFDLSNIESLRTEATHYLFGRLGSSAFAKSSEGR